MERRFQTCGGGCGDGAIAPSSQRGDEKSKAQRAGPLGPVRIPAVRIEILSLRNARRHEQSHEQSGLLHTTRSSQTNGARPKTEQSLYHYEGARQVEIFGRVSTPVPLGQRSTFSSS
jgi:hypothetical protein